ncbi:MAG: YajQ family cyclic di-GMP-binding protein [Gammaproteobacteria bacterium]|nr:YajQ family cyclic di-GMP-binding protein [Gammaproteobacteria bacterium]
MPSFDVVSEVDHHELTNAVDQVSRELANRFDFKGSNASIVESEDGLKLEAESEFQLQQIISLLHQKASKRGLDLASFAEKDIESRGGRTYLFVEILEGIDKESAKTVVKLIKDSKLKVQAAIQGEQVRVSGKKRDDLQQVMALLRESSIPIPLQFNNFRD